MITLTMMCNMITSGNVRDECENGELHFVWFPVLRARQLFLIGKKRRGEGKHADFFVWFPSVCFFKN